MKKIKSFCCIMCVLALFLPGCWSVFENDSSGDQTLLSEEGEEQASESAVAAWALADMDNLVSPACDTAFNDSAAYMLSYDLYDQSDTTLIDEIINSLSQYGPGVSIEKISDDPVVLGVTFDQVVTARGNTVNGYMEITVLDDGDTLLFDFDHMKVGNKEFSGQATFTKLGGGGGYSVTTQDLEVIWETKKKTLLLDITNIEMVYIDTETAETVSTEGSMDVTVDGKTITITFNEFIINRDERYPTGQVTLSIGDFDLVITFFGTSTVAIGNGKGLELKVHLPSGLRGNILGRHIGGVRSVCFSPDNRFLASAGRDGTVKVWNTGSRRLYHPLHLFEHTINSIAYSPDGTMLAAGGEDSVIKIINTENYRVIVEREMNSPINSLAWSPDGLFLAAAMQDWSVVVLAVSEEIVPVALLSGIEGHHDRVLSVAWSPDGGIIASGGADYVIKIWKEKETGPGFELLHTLEKHESDVTGVDFFYDGLLVSSGSDTRVCVWDPVSGELLATGKWPEDEIPPILGYCSIAASSNSHMFVVGSYDDYPFVTWYYTANPVIKLVGFESVRANSDDTDSVDLSADGYYMGSGSTDGTVKLFSW